MATVTLPITGAWWGTGGNRSWTAADFIQCGNDGANYRSKIAISTAGLTIVSSTRLVLEIQSYSKCSPFGVECILSRDNSILANDCQNSYAGAASDTLNNAAIDRSFAYADAECTTLLTTSTGIDMAVGSKFYLLFEGSQLEQNQTYYLYFIRNLRDGYTGSGWFEAYTAAVIPTLTYVNYTAIAAPNELATEPALFEGAVTLRWGAAVDGNNNPVTGYQLCYQDSADGVTWGQWQDLAYPGANDRTYIDDPQIDRGTYRRYHIRALGGTGIEEFDSPYVSVDIRRNRLPAAPAQANVSAVLIASGQEVEISWESAADPDGDVCSYVVSRLVGDVWMETDVGTDLLFREVRQGSAAEVTQYAVCAYDSLGARSAWVFSDYITFNSPPSAPSAAQLDKGEYSPGDAVTVSWSGVQDVDGNLLGCVLGYRLSEEENWTELGRLDSSEGDGQITFRPEQAQYGQRIYLAVRSVDSLGAQSAWLCVGSILRNDEPHTHIFENGVPGNYVPGIGVGRYMPYIRVNGQWIRHPGER